MPPRCPPTLRRGGRGKPGPRIPLHAPPRPSAAGLWGSLPRRRFCRPTLPWKDHALNSQGSHHSFSPFPSFHLSSGPFVGSRCRRAAGTERFGSRLENTKALSAASLNPTPRTHRQQHPRAFTGEPHGSTHRFQVRGPNQTRIRHGPHLRVRIQFRRSDGIALDGGAVRSVAASPSGSRGEPFPLGRQEGRSRERKGTL